MRGRKESETTETTATFLVIFPTTVSFPKSANVYKIFPLLVIKKEKEKVSVIWRGEITTKQLFITI